METAAAIRTGGLYSPPSTPSAAASAPRRSLHGFLRFQPLRTAHGARPAAGLPSPALRCYRQVHASANFWEKQGNFLSSRSVPAARPLLLPGDGYIRDGFRRRERREGGDDRKNTQTCGAGVAVPSASDGGGGVAEPQKFLGVEVVTLKKILPLGLMFFCILFNYTILRDTKDVLVVTAKGSSAEIIPFLKTWVNLPMAIGFMLLYTKLSNVLSKEALFYSVIVPFIAFFGAFGFFMYPLTDVIHPTGLADRLLDVLGPRFLGPVAILRIWSFCLFYVMAELWGSVVISVLFWGFANQVTYTEPARPVHSEDFVVNVGL